MGSWGEQFSTGDQYKSSRETFWEGGFRVCVECQSKNIVSNTVVAGCRHNGDGYGTEIFQCKDCKWETSFQYDEADTPYYYETRFWGKNYFPPTPPPPKILNEEDRKTFTQLKKLAPLEAVAQMMRARGYNEDTISLFLTS